MGLFGGSKTYVSSVVYNLAGDVEGRPNYLKTIVVGSMLLDDNRSKGDIIRSGYQRGQGLKIRNYYRWALENYAPIGIPQATLKGNIEIDPSKIEGIIPKPPGSLAMVQTVDTGAADYSYWAEQWMLENRPALIETEWTADYIDATERIQVTFADSTSAFFTPMDFDKNAQYIYAAYSLDLGGSTGSLVPGTEVMLTAIENYPSTVGWTTATNSAVATTESLSTTTTTTLTYSDARPAEVATTTTVRTEVYDRLKAIYKKTVFQGEQVTSTIDKLKAIDSTMYLSLGASVVIVETTTVTTAEIAGGVTRTTTAVAQAQTLKFNRSYRIDTIERVVKNWSGAKLLIYRIGSGNAALDALASEAAVNLSGAGTADGYLPFIPVRIDNKFVSPSYLPAIYNLAKRAYKKTSGSKFDDLVTKLQDNPNLADIDYAYVMFGASMNSNDQSSLKYIYQFFDRVRQSSSRDLGAFSRWKNYELVSNADMEDLVDWRLAQKLPGTAAYGTPAPYFGGNSGVPITEIRINATGPGVKSNVDIRISWNNINRETGSGLLKPGAKAGEIWFNAGPKSFFNNKGLLSWGRVIAGKLASFQVLEMCQQVSATKWTKLIITGLVHRNYIYDGKFVETTITDALADAEETDFIIPIHYNTFRQMSLVDATQMAGECTYLVVNSYKVVKQKWYQTGIFRIILIVVVVALVIIFPPAGGAVGLLGTSAAVGAAIGLAGLAAIIVGTIINVFAAMLLIKLIQVGAIALFGEKLGAIIGAIVGIIAVAAGTGAMNGQSFSSVVHSMSRADSLIAMTSAIGDSVSAVIMASARETGMKTQELIKDYTKDSQAISDLYAKNLGYDNGIFDPMNLTNSPRLLIESPDAFLQRTLMTGSDIAGISMEMIYNFSDLTLSNKLPL